MDPAIDILRKGKSHAVAQDFTRELSEAWEWECNCTLALAEPGKQESHFPSLHMTGTLTSVRCMRVWNVCRVVIDR